MFPLLLVVRSFVLHILRLVKFAYGVILLFELRLFAFVGVGVATGVGVTVATGVGVGVGVATGFGLTIATPLFQTSFLPLFIHVYFLPAKIEICPDFLQVAPGLIAAAACKGVTSANIRVSASKFFFMG